MPAGLDDLEFILELRNFHRHCFFNQDIITIEEHEEFMEEHRHNYFIGYINGQRAGFVGVVEGDIRLAIKPRFMGMGLGKYMLEYIYFRFPRAKGKIFEDNVSSIAAFKSAGVPYETI